MTDEKPQAALIAALLAVDPKGLGGVWLRARHGPARDRLVEHLTAIEGLHGKAMPEIGDTELFGGIDLSESLVSGRLAERKGLIESVDVVWLTRAERMPVRLAARIASAVDRGVAGMIVLCDESAEAEEAPPAALRDRLAFFLSDETPSGCRNSWSRKAVQKARETVGKVDIDDALIAMAVRVAIEAGCTGSRPALFLIRAARALAALEDAPHVCKEHLRRAAMLVLPHRMRPVSEDQTEANQPLVEDTPHDADSDDPGAEEELLREIVLEAAQVPLPDGLLAGLVSRDRRGAGSGHGSERVSRLRGRPLPSRPGSSDGRSRLDILATLQAAAPWQKLRDRSQGRLSLRSSDLRLGRFRERSERMLLFVVDASGSAAMARLAEAKGAAETILSEAYRSRDHVSLITFRGDGADCALEPTRSLVRAKRLLGGLPGGGATPLAAALKQSAEQAMRAQRKGLTPHVILMTDGRANKALDGSTNRVAAQEDARAMARFLGATGVKALVVDSGLRPSPDLEAIAQALRARTIRLPKGRRGQASAELMAALDG